jgi:hypothetical protein
MYRAAAPQLQQQQQQRELARSARDAMAEAKLFTISNFLYPSSEIFGGPHRLDS